MKIHLSMARIMGLTFLQIKKTMMRHFGRRSFGGGRVAVMRTSSLKITTRFPISLRFVFLGSSVIALIPGGPLKNLLRIIYGSIYISQDPGPESPAGLSDLGGSKISLNNPERGSRFPNV